MMEELLQYCMHELAFDGDLGCNIDRLKVFIHNYYEGLQPPYVQTLDNAFFAFVWHLLRQQPSLQIKLIKETSLEVSIAPQKSKASKGESGGNEATVAGGTELLDEAKTLSLSELLQTYGDGLRVAVDPETCFRALTGSHIRQPKLTPMVYTALQFISRYREEGLSVVDLGKKTGYDQKTCFYLVKQLLSMDYVVKLAKGGSGGGNFCIHKSFYLRSPFWQGIRDETDQALRDGDNQHDQSFVQIDSRHLASPELIRSRIVKLLKFSENGLHSYHNLLVAIGFEKPTKQDRRFFIIRIRELIKEKVIEKVLVPRKGKQSSKALCIRLVEDPRNTSLDGVVVQNDDVDEEELDQKEEGLEISRKHDAYPEAEIKMPLVHMTIQRQIIQLLEEAGADGLTLNDISTRLGKFDKRTLDLLLHRMANFVPPHLADLGICVFIENLGRERRHRYFTFSGYEKFIRNENIDVTEHSPPFRAIDKTQCGNFSVVSAETFYEDRKKLTKYEDDLIHLPKTKSHKALQKLEEPTKATKSTKAESGISNKGKKRPRSGDPESIGMDSLTSSNKRARVSKRKNQEVVGEGSGGPSINAMGTAVTDKMEIIPTNDDKNLDPALAIIQKATPEVNALDTYEAASNKRPPDQYDLEGPSTKRPKPDKIARNAVNLSQLRAENEILRVVHEFGGIANIASKEFFEAHSKVLSLLAANGEAISMPVGTQLDRRTLRKILARLADRNRLKTLTVTVTPRSVQPRVAKLIYIPEISQDKVDSFVETLQDQTPIVSAVIHKELEDAVDYSNYLRTQNLSSQVMSPRGKVGSSNKADKSINSRRAIEFVGSDEEIRTRLLADSRTSSQLFGFILGKARRARELHQFTLHAFLHTTESGNIVSHRNRILSLSYYFHDMPVSTYFSVISASEYNQELYDLMKTESGRQMRVGDLSSSLYQTLNIGKTRSRSRLLDLMEVLMSLGLITPLKPSSESTASITCASGESYPKFYDIFVTTDKSKLNKMASYWQFKEAAPIYNYSQPDWPPSFHREMSVRTADESTAYWDELEKNCLEKKDSITSMSAESVAGPCQCSPSVVHILRKRSSWSSAYMLSWEQEQYLQQKWTDSLTGYTPLSDEDGGRRALIRICEIISAPFDAVYNYFLDSHQAFQREVRRILKKHRREAGVADGRDLEEKASLARTIADSKQRLASDWECLVQQVHPGISTRKLAVLKDLRIDYMQHRGTASPEEWRARISEALTYRIKDRPTLTNVRTTYGPQRNFAESVHEGPSVGELAQKLKTSTPFAIQERKKKDPNKQSPAHKSRSRRFHWTAEYDELARDASAIIRSRCRSWGRMDWTALDQVFLPLPRNNVRQRIATLRQEPGGESYFRRLEDKWHQIWMEYRQTESLPDPNSENPSEFDLIAHIEFLRKNIDKSSLKLGGSDLDTEDIGYALSEDISEFLSRWDVIEYPYLADGVEVIFGSAAEEQRENILLRQAVVIRRDSDRPPDSSTQMECLAVAECALKMVFSTPENVYDPNLASSFLESIGKQLIDVATKNLLNRGVIEIIKSDRQTPGRNMRFTDLNYEASGGFFRPEFYKQALAIDDILEEDIDENKEWDLVFQGGQMAGLIDFVSRGEIQFVIDISEPIYHRKELDWNSKKVDDDQLETIINMRYRSSSYPNLEMKSQTTFLNPLRVNPAWEAHETSDGSACHLTSIGIINCSGCLDTVHNLFLQNIGEEANLFLDIAQKVEAAGSNGLSRNMTNDHVIMSDAKRFRLLHSMLSGEPPLCYWTGYDQPVLVSARHIRPWTVLLPISPTTYVFPRRWIDLKGRRITSSWQSALYAVASVLFLRPGLSVAELRRKLISVYDRQEVNSILQFLLANNFISMANPQKYFTAPQFSDIGVSEEEHVALSLTCVERWYDVFKE